MGDDNERPKGHKAQQWKRWDRKGCVWPCIIDQGDQRYFYANTLEKWTLAYEIEYIGHTDLILL